MKHHQFWTVFGLAVLGSAGTARADLTYVAVDTGFYNLYNSYDSINGLRQVSSFNSGTAGSAVLTQSVSPTSASVGLNGSANNPNVNITDSGVGTAYANLALGAVGVSASSATGQNNVGGGQNVISQAMLQDTITFDNTSGQTVDIDVYWTFDGTTSTVSSEFGNTTFGSYFCFDSSSGCQAQGGIGNVNTGNCCIPQGTSDARFSYQYSLVGFGGLSVTTPSSGWVSSSYTSTPLNPGGQLSTGMNTEQVVFHGVYALPAGISTDYVYGNLTASCGGGEMISQGCDFSHTGALSFDLNDPGVSFTSASGALLTGTVPEPGSWIMVATVLGLLSVGKVRRQRR